MLLPLISTLLFLAIALLTLPRIITSLSTHKYIYRSVEELPKHRVAIVFGAGLWRDGSPTPVLRDRIATAAQLFFSGKIEKLLMSGDNRFVDYNEPQAMKKYAINLGVPNEAIVLDYAGRRSYDTCYRALHIFSLQEAILVTQNFHLPRTLYTCHILGVNAIGISADLRRYRRIWMLYWNIRELFATLVAMWELHIARPVPLLGNPEPIFPEEAQ